MSPPAPLYRDTLDLSRWTLQAFRQAPPAVAQRAERAALDLLEHVVFALKGRDREERVAAADDALLSLRIWLRVAAECGALTDEQLQHALGATSSIGKQIGGWRKHVDGLR